MPCSPSPTWPSRRPGRRSATGRARSWCWTRPPATQAPGLAGYRIHWRLTTEPQWTHSRYVGNVDTYTLENVVIDNYFFGVSAVGTHGAESPVVFPGAAGSFGGYATAP